MLRPRQIAGFGLRLAVFYTLLMAPWPGLSEAYGSFYRVVVQIAVISVDPEHSVVVAPAGRSVTADTGSMLDTHILARVPEGLRDSKAGVLESTRSSRYSGYLPTVLTVALILATPLPWKRRAVAVCVGTLLVTLFIACMPGIQFYAMFDRKHNHLVFEWIPWLYPHWRMLVHGLAKVSMWATPYYLVPILIWVLIAFRREDWIRVIEQLAANARPRPASHS